eukprot:16435334-Heterocapsa_arctica.AAC.1
MSGNNNGDLRVTILDYLMRNRAFSMDGTMQRADPMLVVAIEGEQIDAVLKGKGKGGPNGKGKLKGKMKTSTPTSPSSTTTPKSKTMEGWLIRPCWHCGWRHMDAMCPQNRTVTPTTSTTTSTQLKGAGKRAKGQGRGKDKFAPAVNPNYYASLTTPSECQPRAASSRKPFFFAGGRPRAAGRLRAAAAP